MTLQAEKGRYFEPLNRNRISNKLNYILLLRGIRQDYEPNSLYLNHLEMSSQRFNVIRNNEDQPSFSETYRLVAWLGIEFRELYSVLL
ncbi:MAG: hypothetical protein HRT71_06395 [Flavobacteriales bacterium]|nr:hypothetical protein [Flavobacteriales bacterium]